jgi:hypothetical protein
LETVFFSDASTIPSTDCKPTHVPALLIASIAYSTWCNRPNYNYILNYFKLWIMLKIPSGENVVVDWSYLLDILF